MSRAPEDSFFIVVELPIEQIKKKFQVNSRTSVQDVLDLVARKISHLRLPLACIADYGILNPVTLGALHPSTLIVDTCATHFLFRRVVVRANVTHEEETAIRRLEMEPKATMDDVVARILSQEWGKHMKGQPYVLSLISANTAAAKKRAMRVDMHRTVASYRLKPTDLLYYGPKMGATRSGIFRVISSNERLVLQFDDQDSNIQKTMVVSESDMVRDVLDTFLLKVDPSSSRLAGSYGLFRHQDGNWQLMNLDWVIGSFELEPMTKIICRQLVKVPKKMFGVDPVPLPTVVDNGLEVPMVLVRIRDWLEAENAFQTEGIFRVAGTESEMQRLRPALNFNEPVGDVACHSMATMLKRWYKELPKSLFQDIPEDIMIDEVKAKTAPTYLSPLYRNIFDWLIDLLAMTALNEDKTKMSSKNLAIVWGPGLAVLEENPLASLTNTRYAIEMLEWHINWRLESPRCPPSRPVRVDEVPPMPVSSNLLKKKFPRPPLTPSRDEETALQAEDECKETMLQAEDDCNGAEDVSEQNADGVDDLPQGIQRLLQFAPPPSHPAPPPPKWRDHAISPRESPLSPRNQALSPRDRAHSLRAPSVSPRIGRSPGREMLSPRSQAGMTLQLPSPSAQAPLSPRAILALKAKSGARKLSDSPAWQRPRAPSKPLVGSQRKGSVPP